MSISILYALIILGGLGIVFGIGLAIASKIFSVEKDTRVLDIEAILPGANCGACGAPGCAGFAEGVVEGKYPANGCTVGGSEVAHKVAQIMGIEAAEVVAKVAVVRCRGDRENCIDRALYHGIPDCRAAILVDNGSKGCIYGCLGFGNCETVCPFDAIVMQDNGLPKVIESRCTGCGECVKACPRHIMELIPRKQQVYVACVSKDFGKDVKKVCKVGCIGCSLCANPKTTLNEIITMDGKIPVIHYDRIKNPWEDLENAVNKCPTKSFGNREKSSSEPDNKITEDEVSITTDQYQPDTKVK